MVFILFSPWTPIASVFLQDPVLHHERTNLIRSSQLDASNDSFSNEFTQIDSTSEAGSIYSLSSKDLTFEDQYSDDEINENTSLSYFLNSYQTDDSVFSPSQL